MAEHKRHSEDSPGYDVHQIFQDCYGGDPLKKETAIEKFRNQAVKEFLHDYALKSEVPEDIQPLLSEYPKLHADIKDLAKRELNLSRRRRRRPAPVPADVDWDTPKPGPSRLGLAISHPELAILKAETEALTEAFKKLLGSLEKDPEWKERAEKARSTLEGPSDTNSLDIVASDSSQKKETSSVASTEEFNALASFVGVDIGQPRLEYSQPLRYIPLANGQIRLLLLHPETDTSGLHISLAVVNISKASDYEALSYVWGSSDKPHKIQCDFLGKIETDKLHRTNPKYLPPALSSGFIAVTDNLHVALLGLRKTHSIRALWVDSACIYQGHSRERSEQIQLMYQVYSKAREVTVWLGTANDSTDLAFNCLEELYDLHTEGFCYKYSRSPIRLKRNIDHTHWKALCSFFSQQWFSRLWIFQESVSNMETKIQQGHRDISWFAFSCACEVVSYLRRGSTRGIAVPVNMEKDYDSQTQHQNQHLHEIYAANFSSLSSYSGNTVDILLSDILDCGESFGNDFPTRSLDAALDMENVRGITTFSGKSGQIDTSPLRLKNLLPIVRQSHATDARDKVFGLLSLASITAEQLPKADYSRTVRQVYIMTARYWLESELTADLEFLNHVQDSKEEHQLPSWTPDWSCPLTSPLLLHAHSKYSRNAFKAAGSSAVTAQIDYKFSKDSVSTALTLKGVFLMTIQSIEADDTRGKFYHGMIAEVRKKKPRNKGKTYPTTTQSYLYAFREMIDLGKPSSYNTRQNYWEFESGGRKAFKIRDYERRGLEPEEYTLDRFKGIVEKSENAHYVKDGVFHRSFFVSSSGFIGLAPLSAVSGDILCLFLGSRTPFVIRQVEGHYTLLGECYIYGLMHGEGMEDLPEEKIVDIELW